MRPTESMRTQIGMLVVATSAIQLANGFFGTFISLRVAIENFDATMAGLVLSSYFAGFTLGALRCGRIIERIGHIRAYAAFCGLVVAATAAMPLWAGPLAWLILRAVIGFGCSGIFVTTESWLNAKAQSSQRGLIFSVYMVGTFVALAVGQLLIGSADIESSAPFDVIVTLFAVALVMVSTTRAEPPRVTAATKLPYGELSRAAPVAVIGCVVSGLVSSAFYALVPAWMQGESIERTTIALFMLVAVLGGLVFQVPVGRLSDRFDRRIVLAALGAGFAGTAVALVLLPHSRPIVPDDGGSPGWLYVDALSGLRRPRARPHACRSGGSGQWQTDSGERARLSDWPTYRHNHHGAFRYRRRILLYGRSCGPFGSRRCGAEYDHGAAVAPGAAVRDPGAAGSIACTRSTRHIRRNIVASAGRSCCRRKLTMPGRKWLNAGLPRCHWPSSHCYRPALRCGFLNWSCLDPLPVAHSSGPT